MEGVQSPDSPGGNSIGNRLHPSPSTILKEDWQQKAEEELNETPENYKQKTNALRLLVMSMIEVKYFLGTGVIYLPF